MRVAIQCEDAVRSAVVEDGVGIFGGWDTAKNFEGLEIEHGHGLAIPLGGESMPRSLRHRGSVCALNASDLAEQRPLVFIDDHYAILPGDKQTVIGWIG